MPTDEEYQRWLKKKSEFTNEEVNNMLSRAEKAEAEIQRLRTILITMHIDPDRCEKFPKGERCALKPGHEGGCKWANGD